MVSHTNCSTVRSLTVRSLHMSFCQHKQTNEQNEQLNSFLYGKFNDAVYIYCFQKCKKISFFGGCRSAPVKAME